MFSPPTKFNLQQLLQICYPLSIPVSPTTLMLKLNSEEFPEFCPPFSQEITGIKILH